MGSNHTAISLLPQSTHSLVRYTAPPLTAHSLLHILPTHNPSPLHHPHIYHPPHIVQVREDEGFADVKTASDDVLCVFHSQTVALVQRQVLPEKFLVICHLHHPGHVEDVLQIPVQAGRLKGRGREGGCVIVAFALLGEVEWDEMAQVHGL